MFISRVYTLQPLWITHGLSVQASKSFRVIWIYRILGLNLLLIQARIFLSMESELVINGMCTAWHLDLLHVVFYCFELPGLETCCWYQILPYSIN
jgi:hypothetical protein